MGEKSTARAAEKGKPIYVEVVIRSSIERVWQLSQDPDLHPRWDLRFSRIVPIDRNSRGHECFRYEFKLPFHTIHGTGTSQGHRHRSDGQATSVLKFDTSDALSPIGQGAGYWRYIPTGNGLRFITGYNYEPGMGPLGRLLDTPFIRPALGWATALSFDRLRIWAESDLNPRKSRNRWVIDAAARTCGLLTAGILILRPLEGRASTAAKVAGVGVALAAWLAPAHKTIPRAGRCLRQAPDAGTARAPAALADLESPAKANKVRGSSKP